VPKARVTCHFPYAPFAAKKIVSGSQMASQHGSQQQTQTQYPEHAKLLFHLISHTDLKNKFIKVIGLPGLEGLDHNAIKSLARSSKNWIS
jgi:hypothetical protein